MKGDIQHWGFVFAPDADFLGLLENALRSFWKPGLSRLSASESAILKPRTPRQMTPQEKAQRAKELGDSGSKCRCYRGEFPFF